MDTISTRSRRKKTREQSRTAPLTERNETARGAGGKVSERAWLISSASILVVGAILRLHDLKLVPLHHDEGVNGNFLVRLVRDGYYQYDPANYHGPTLYYLAAIIPWTFRFLFGPSAQNTYGLNTITIRLVPAAFGLATIWLVLLLRRHLGTVAALSAAALIAISPGAVYLSRYFIHETLLVFFTLGVVVAALTYYEDGRPVYLILAAASAALLFATKETAIISAAVLVIALVATRLYLWLRTYGKVRQDSVAQEAHDAVIRLGGPGKLALWAAVAVAIFIAVSGLLFSSFFTNFPKGVYDALKTFQFWSKTGEQAHVHDRWTYVYWLFQEELPVLSLATVGGALIFWKPRNSFALFSALWGFGILAAYSLLPYKTPWLALNFIIPLALIAGYAIEKIYKGAADQVRVLTLIGVAVIGLSAYQTVVLNFFNYDDDHYPYVYAHTRRDTLKLVDEIDRIAQRSGTGTQIGITIVSPDYWPLPWYLRDYPRVGYFGRMTSSNEAVIIGSEGQGAEIQTTFGEHYKQVNSGLNSAGSFSLRPGVNLLLYVRQELAQP
jgi:uncharacterized protein (TIGR03663 family)